MRKVSVLIILSILGGCMWTHSGMDHGYNKDGSSCHQHQGGCANKT